MNALKKISVPPWLTLCLGVPAMLFALVLNLTGLDERDLFIPGHYAGILVWVLTAAMVVLLARYLPMMGGRAKYSRVFPPSALGMAGILGAAVSVAWSGWELFCAAAALMETVVGVLGMASGAVMVYLAWCRFRGIRGSFLLWGCVTVFLMLRLMFAYRGWSGQPELLRYCFPLLASVCVLLAFYYRTAFSVGMGSRRMYLFFTQMGGFFCMVTLAGGFDLFYAGMLLWSLTDLCSQRPMRSAPREPAPEVQP